MLRKGLLTTVAVLAATASAPAAAGASGVSHASYAPVLSYVSPDVGITPGEQVALVGTNFLGATAVDFGSVSAEFELLTPEWIVATVPQGSGSVYVSVTTPDGTSQTGGPGTGVSFLSPSAPPMTATTSTAPLQLHRARLAHHGRRHHRKHHRHGA